MRRSWEELIWGTLALIPAFSPEEKVDRPPLRTGSGMRLQSSAVVSSGAVSGCALGAVALHLALRLLGDRLPPCRPQVSVHLCVRTDGTVDSGSSRALHCW